MTKPLKSANDPRLEWTCECEPETDLDYREDGCSHEDADECHEWVREQLDAGNEWAWCSVRVRVTFTPEEDDAETFIGDDYLGGCSYKSKADFMSSDGYYQDMRNEAFDRLLESMAEAISRGSLAKSYVPTKWLNPRIAK